MEPRNRFHFTLLLLLHMSCFASRSSCALTIKLSYPKAFEIEENFQYGGMRQIYIFWLPTLPLTSPPDTAEELSHKEGIKA